MNSSISIATGDVIDLAILGTARENSLPLAELVHAVRLLCGARFQPTTEVIGERISALLQGGYLRQHDAHGAPCWVSTESGWLYASERLSNAQVSAPETLAEVYTRIRLAYLELLDATGKDCVLDSLIGEHGRKLQQAQEALKHCPPPVTLARSALVTAVERLRQDLQWLRDLQRRVLT